MDLAAGAAARTVTAALPGLTVAGIAAALVWALWRWFDPLPGRALAAFIAILLVLFAPVLFGGQYLLPLDGLRGHAPWRTLAPAEPHGNPLQGDLLSLILPLQKSVRSAYAAGEWPLWNPRVGAGMPLLADPQAQALQPLVAMAVFLPLAAAAGAVAALRVLCALVFTFLFLRRQRLSEPAALAGALAYGLGGFVQLWLGWPLANAAALLPLLLYSIAVVADRGAARDAALLAVAAFAVMAAGQPEAILYCLGFALLYVAARVRVAHRRSRVERARLLARTAGALLIAAAVAAPLLLPVWNHLPRTERAAARRAAAASSTPAASDQRSWTAKARHRLLPVAAPNAFGNSRYGDPSGTSYWGEQNTNEDAAGFAGTAMLLAAATGLGFRRRFPQERLAWLVLAGALAVVALPPALDRALGALPLWQFSATGHHRLLLPISFCVAWLGACGVERARLGELRAGVLAAIAVGLALLLAWAMATHHDSRHPEALAELRRGTLLLQLKVAAAGALLLAAAARLRPALWVFAFLAAAELVVLHRPANPAAPARLWLPETAPLPALRSILRDDRMAGLGDALPANLPALWELSDARSYNPATPEVYRRLVAPLLPAGGDSRAFVVGEHPLYDLLGVRFLLAEPDAGVPPESIRVESGEDGALFERPGALPLLFLPPSWVPATMPWDELARSRPNYSARAWLYGAPEVAADRATRGELVYRALGPARLRAGASVPTARVFATRILQDGRAGGWRLLVNGKPRRSFLANGPLLAGALGPADRVVDLLYRPPGFVAGALLAALGAAAALAWWLQPPRRDAPLGRPRPIEEGRALDLAGAGGLPSTALRERRVVSRLSPSAG